MVKTNKMKCYKVENRNTGKIDFAMSRQELLDIGLTPFVASKAQNTLVCHNDRTYATNDWFIWYVDVEVEIREVENKGVEQ